MPDDRYLKLFTDWVKLEVIIKELGTQRTRWVVRDYLNQKWIERQGGRTDPQYRLTLIGRFALDRYLGVK